MHVLYSNSRIFVIPVYIFNGRKQALVDTLGYCQRCACVVCMTSASSWPNCVSRVARIGGSNINSSCNLLHTLRRSNVASAYNTTFLHASTQSINQTTLTCQDFHLPILFHEISNAHSGINLDTVVILQHFKMKLHHHRYNRFAYDLWSFCTWPSMPKCCQPIFLYSAR